MKNSRKKTVKINKKRVTEAQLNDLRIANAVYQSEEL